MTTEATAADRVERVRTYSELVAERGRRGLRQAVHAGEVIRARRDTYLAAGIPEAFIRAARVGGRLTCLSLLQERGVFVHTNAALHVHVPVTAGRLRSAQDAGTRLAARARRAEVVHWNVALRPAPDDGVTVDPVDAVAHAIRCQSPRHALASIDSALHIGFLRPKDLDPLFAGLPKKYRFLRALIDRRAESGPETLVRLMLRALGCRVEVQVDFAGVGRVDMVVDGWLVVECDSKEFHSDWEQQVKDRARDMELARRGYVTVRLLAAHILYQPDLVLAALRGIVAAHKR